MRCLGGRASLPTTTDQRSQTSSYGIAPPRAPSPGTVCGHAARYEQVDQGVCSTGPAPDAAQRLTALEESRSWAGRFTEQSWAIESAGGLGYLLAELISVPSMVS